MIYHLLTEEHVYGVFACLFVCLCVCVCMFYCAQTLTDEMDPPLSQSVSVFLQPEKRGPQTHINTLIYHRSTARVQQGGKVTATVPLQAAYISEQIPIQFPSHSKER